MQKKNSKRVNIYIDNEYAFSCNLDIVYTNNLKKGKLVDTQVLSEIISEDNYLKCKNTALRSLEKSNKTEKDMYSKLLTKGYENETIERVIYFLKQYEFIDDSKYAEMYIKDKSNQQGISKIKYSLLRKGISQEIISEKLQLIDKEDEFITALQLAKKKYIILCKSETDKRKLYRKLGDYLIRKGYSYDVVNKILGKVISNEY